MPRMLCHGGSILCHGRAGAFNATIACFTSGTSSHGRARSYGGAFIAALIGGFADEDTMLHFRMGRKGSKRTSWETW